MFFEMKSTVLEHLELLALDMSLPERWEQCALQVGHKRTLREALHLLLTLLRLASLRLCLLLLLLHTPTARMSRVLDTSTSGIRVSTRRVTTRTAASSTATMEDLGAQLCAQTLRFRSASTSRRLLPAHCRCQTLLLRRLQTRIHRIAMKIIQVGGMTILLQFHDAHPKERLWQSQGA